MADRVAAHRAKMKAEDPARYQLYLDKQKEASKKRRDMMKKELKKKEVNPIVAEKQLHQRKLALERQKRYIAKHKNEQKPKKAKPTKVLTRSEIKEKRERNREYKRKEREGQSRQKKDGIHHKVQTWK